MWVAGNNNNLFPLCVGWYDVQYWGVLVIFKFLLLKFFLIYSIYCIEWKIVILFKKHLLTNENKLKRKWKLNT